MMVVHELVSHELTNQINQSTDRAIVQISRPCVSSLFRFRAATVMPGGTVFHRFPQFALLAIAPPYRGDTDVSCCVYLRD